MDDRQIKAALEVFSEKWKPIIIYHLIHEGKNDIAKYKGLSQKLIKEC